MTERDTFFMNRALELARLGRGLVSPNPMVGAVVVKDGRIVGEGYHRYDRLRHAESFALEQAERQTRGATMYCTLEPCCHVGRTPPCTDSLIEAGIARVIVAAIDPDPRVSGRGVEKLRQRGTTVDLGLCVEQATRLNEIYLKHITTRAPFVHVVQFGDAIHESAERQVWEPSPWFCESAFAYDAVVVSRTGPWMRTIVSSCLGETRHRPLVLAGTKNTIEALGLADRADVRSLSVECGELQDIEGLLGRVSALDATSILVVGGTAGRRPLLADKITLVSDGDVEASSPALEQTRVFKSVGVLEVTGYPR